MQYASTEVAQNLSKFAGRSHPLGIEQNIEILP